MIIAIDLTSLSYHMTGIERYAACITEKMLDEDTQNTYVLIFRDSIHPIFEKRIDNVRIKAKVLHGNNKIVFLQLILPYYLYRIKADKYLFFAFPSPILFKKNGIYNTIHDMGPWDSSESMKTIQKIYWRITLKYATRVATGIITVSEFSKMRISQLLNYSEKKIRVIPSAVYDGFTKTADISYEQIRELYDLPEKYIMTLSTLEPRKNVKILLQAFSKIQDKVDYDLVLIGRKGWMMDEVLNRYNLQNKIHITGFVDDIHVASIYKHALCFVFPSLYEGFGLPPVEALSLGTPVIASNAASIPEVLMDQAVYFENNSESELQKLLLNLENMLPTMAHELTELQKKEYSFSTSAKKVLEYICT